MEKGEEVLLLVAGTQSGVGKVRLRVRESESVDCVEALWAVTAVNVHAFECDSTPRADHTAEGGAVERIALGGGG